MTRKSTGAILMVLTMSAMLALTDTAIAGNGEKPMTPEMAAKKENFRKQKDQQITHSQRKSSADALKNERLKVYAAKQQSKKTKLEHKDHE